MMVLNRKKTAAGGGDNAFDNGNDSGTEVDESDDDSLQFDDGSSSEGGYDEMEWEMDELEYLTEPYPVKYWLHHGSKATAEFADDLSGDEIWEPNSPILRRWLLAYTRMTKDFQDFEPESFHALHVAASIGFRQLVTSLIDNGHEDEMHQYDSLGNTPVGATIYPRPQVKVKRLTRYQASLGGLLWAAKHSAGASGSRRRGRQTRIRRQHATSHGSRERQC